MIVATRYAGFLVACLAALVLATWAVWNDHEARKNRPLQVVGRNGQTPRRQPVGRRTEILVQGKRARTTAAPSLEPPAQVDGRGADKPDAARAALAPRPFGSRAAPDRFDATASPATHSHTAPSRQPSRQVVRSPLQTADGRSEKDSETFELYTLYQSRQWATLHRDDLATLRDQMVSDAEDHPNDALSPELLQAASDLSLRLGEPAVAESLLREAVEHPQIEPTSRIFAWHRVAMFAWARQDVAQMFEDLNALLDEVQRLPPGLRSGYSYWSETVASLKAAALKQLLERGEAIPADLPPRDRGRTASDYYAALLRNAASSTASDAPVSVSWTVQANYAVSLALEGRPEDAVAVYERLLEDATRKPARFSSSWRGLQPEGLVPLVWVLSMARALDPELTDGYVSFLRSEHARGRLSEREQAALALAIASAELQQGHSQSYIQTVEPWLTDNALRVHAWLQEAPDQFGRLMAKLGHAYALPDVADYPQAAVWYTAYAMLDDAYLSTDMLRDVLVRLARLYDHGPLHDAEQALQWYRRYLELFGDNDPLGVSARDAIARILAESESMNSREGEQP